MGHGRELRGDGGWRCQSCEEVALAKDVEREAARKPVVAEGHPGCGNTSVVGLGPLFAPTGLVTLSCGSDRLFTSPLIKINGPSLLLGSLFPIHLSDGVRLPQWPSCPLTVLEQFSVQP